jgi:hypothetical protein
VKALLLLALAVVIAIVVLRPRSERHLPPKPRLLGDVIPVLDALHGPGLCEAFRKAGVDYPPSALELRAFKQEKRIDLIAPDRSGTLVRVESIPILGASGGPGPKLREGDRQVPEGDYRIELLNPNSAFHLSLRVDYPNAVDIARAQRDGRAIDTLGGDIMIHGGTQSIGCLAIGDPAVERLFLLAHQTGLSRIRLTIRASEE